MAIAFELQAHSDASIDQVFSTIADLRSWGSFAGVALVGPARPVMNGAPAWWHERLATADLWWVSEVPPL